MDGPRRGKPRLYLSFGELRSLDSRGRLSLREFFRRATSTPEARGVIRHAEGEQDEQPEARARNNQAGQFLMRVLHMHEEQDDQGGLDGRDGEGDDGVERAEVDEGRSHGDAGAREQGQPDRDGRIDRGDMFGNVFGNMSGTVFGHLSGNGIVIRHRYLTYAYLT